MTETDTPQPGEREELQPGDIAAARELVNNLCKRGDAAWRMCIPPQPDDSDMLLTRVIDAAERAAGELAEANGETELLTAEERDRLRAQADSMPLHVLSAAYVGVCAQRNAARRSATLRLDELTVARAEVWRMRDLLTRARRNVEHSASHPEGGKSRELLAEIDAALAPAPEVRS